MALKEVYLVIGGSGFVGRHIVQQLQDRGDTVASLDIVQRYHDVPFYSVDITDEEQVADALRKVRRSLREAHFANTSSTEWCNVYNTHSLASCNN